MVAPNVKDRYANVASALQALKPQSKKLKSSIIIASIVTLVGIFNYLNFKTAKNPHSATITNPNI